MKVGSKPGLKGSSESTTSENISSELKVLETYLQKLKRDGKLHNLRIRFSLLAYLIF